MESRAHLCSTHPVECLAGSVQISWIKHWLGHEARKVALEEVEEQMRTEVRRRLA